MNALELLELRHNHARMRESLRVTIGIVRQIMADVGAPPHDPQVGFKLRETWGVATKNLETAPPIFGDVPETRAVLDELGTVVDALGELIS